MKGREITEILDYLQLKEASRRQTLKKNGIPSSTTASSGAGEKGKIPSKEDSPSSETCVQTSNDLSSLSKACRERGNASYKKGQFDEALVAYKEAARLDSSSPLPYSNISALYFEIGKYDACIPWASSAISRIEDKESPLLPKLVNRTIKAHLYRKEYLQGREKVSSLSSDTPERSVFESIIARAESQQLDQKKSWRSLIDLGRYRPALNPARELFNMGHDVTTSQFDYKLSSQKQMRYDFFFGGVSDARHLYATLIDITDHEIKDRPSAPHAKEFYFTVNDVQFPTMARNLIIISLLQDLASAAEASAAFELTMTTIFYVFCSHVVPSVVFEHMQEVIKALIEELDVGNDVLRKPYGVHVSHNYRMGLVVALRRWQDPHFCTLGVADLVKNNLSYWSKLKDQQAALGMFGMLGMIDKRKQPCQQDYALFKEAGVLCGSSQTLQQHDPEFQNLVSQYKQGGKPLNPQLAIYVNKHFKPNVTILDPDWEREYSNNQKNLEYFLFDPFELSKNDDYLTTLFSGKKRPTNLYDWVAPFFEKAAAAFIHLKDRLIIEISCAEVFDALEEVQYETLGLRGKNLPSAYDRIHLSNVPDYCGGNLSSFLLASPLLKGHDSAYLTSTCLRNSPIFPSIHSFNNEYLLINDYDSLYKLLQISKPYDIMDNQMPLQDYIDWYSLHVPPFEFSALLQKDVLTKWLYGLFFKLALPIGNGQRTSNTTVFSPLNMTIYFRLLIRLSKAGYPAHWLSSVVVNIIENTVFTEARPPATIPLEIEEVNRNNSPKKIEASPFSPEMSTLATLFQPVLPFTLMTSNCPHPNRVARYTISCASLRVPYIEESIRNIHSLVFWDSRLLGGILGGIPCSMADWRRLVIEGSESDDNTIQESLLEPRKLKKFRAEGIYLWSTFEWNKEKEEVHVWMRQDFAHQMMQDSKWRAGIVKTDTWHLVTDEEVAKKIVSEGRRWAE